VITVGRDVGRPASDDYTAEQSAFRGGSIECVLVSIGGRPHRDLQNEAARAYMRD
jgi:hypothetical protein